MGVRINSRFWESLSFGMLQQINQVLLILTIFACRFIFLNNYYSRLFHHLYTGLSNGGHIKDGHVVVRSVFVHSLANATSGARTALQIQALSRLHCVTLTPCIDIGFGAGPHLFK